MRAKGCILLFLILVTISSYAQVVTVRAMLDTNKALIGDQIKLRLISEKPQHDWLVSFPVIGDTLSGIEVLSKSAVDTVSMGAGRQRLTQELVVSVFDTGFFEIPALQFAVEHNQSRDSVSTLPLYVQIIPVATDTIIKDIKAIYKAPLTFRETVPYIIGFLILTALTVLLVYYIKRRNRYILRNSEPVRRSTERPDIIAIRDLEALKQEKPWLNNKVKYYYSRISEILRTYIEDRFAIKALEQTTDEILILVKPPVCENSEYQRLSSILNLSDLVKFAKVIPDVTESADCIEQSLEFVNNTSKLQPENSGAGVHKIQNPE